MELGDLPALNATLNGIAGIFLILGWRRIRRGDVRGHRNFMLAALSTSALFLVSYLIHKYNFGDTKFTHEGLPRVVYFFILATHVPLATLMLPPILWLVRLGLKGEIARHHRLARWVLPIWLYVSVTGVLIYFMLYQWYPPERVG